MLHLLQFDLENLKVLRHQKVQGDADKDFQNSLEATVNPLTGPKLRSSNYISLSTAQGARP